MLSVTENAVMSAIYDTCDGNESCMVAPLELIAMLPPKHKISVEKLLEILNSLHYDGYFDLIVGDRKGEKMYVICLREKGFAYKRSASQQKRDFLYKIALAVIGATVTFLFGLILRSIFG